MKYFSTRDNTLKYEASEAIIKGLSRDGGLFIFDFNELEQLSYKNLLKTSFNEKAYLILSQFLSDYDKNVLKNDIDKSYNTNKFTTKNIVNTKTLNSHHSIGELFLGNTFAFKDLALSLYPNLLVSAKKINNNDKTTLILTATSGDTGKAALENFKDVEGINIQVFYPTSGVSILQKLSMQTQSGSNVNVQAIVGNFDDAQNAVKRAFSNEKINNLMSENNIEIGTANSMNIGRLLPQVIYYYQFYCDLVNNKVINEDEKIDIFVPTGNFGNIFAGFIAKKMGLPINKLVICSNDNNVLVDFINTGKYDISNRDFKLTSSPAMDILVSSNIERVLYYITNQNCDRVKKLMSDLNENKLFILNEKEHQILKENFSAQYSTNEKTLKVIKNCFENNNYLIDPHTAVAYDCYLSNKSSNHCLILSTAHPYKFIESLEKVFNYQSDSYKQSINYFRKMSGMYVPKQLEQILNADIIYKDVIKKDNINNSIEEYINEISN